MVHHAHDRASGAPQIASPDPEVQAPPVQSAGSDGTGPVTVVGGGILGTSLAVALAERGVPVTSVDLGSNPASRRSFAWLNAASAATPDYVALRTAGLLHHVVHARHLGERSPYRFEGSLSFDGADGSAAEPVQGEDPVPDDGTGREASLRAKLTLLRSAGLPAQAVTRTRAGELDPAIDWSRAAEPILYAPLEGSVDLEALLELQRERLAELGGDVVEGEALLQAEGGEVRVRTAGRELPEGTVVVAAGSGTPALLGRIGVQVPERTSTGAVITVPGAGSDVRTVLRGPDVSLRPTGTGDLLIHSDRLDRVLGRHIPDAATVRSWNDGNIGHGHPEIQEATERAFDAAETLLALGLDRGGSSLAVGPRPVPADGLPVVGPVAPGLHILFSHSGATLSLVLADLLASQIVDGIAPEILRSFRPARFGIAG